MKTITIEKLTQFLTSEKISQQFKSILNDDPNVSRINFWNKIMLDLLDEYYPNNKYNGLENSEKIIILENPVIPFETADALHLNLAATVWLNSLYEKKYITNIIKIEFEPLYPYTICKLYKDGDLKFNNTCIGDLYCFLVENHINSESGEVKQIIKFLINFLFGVLANGKLLFYSNDVSLITKYSNNMFSKLIKRFEEYIIYIDTDTIYINSDTILFDIIECINSVEIPYNVEKNLDGVFIREKQYMLFRENLIVKNKVIKYKKRFNNVGYKNFVKS